MQAIMYLVHRYRRRLCNGWENRYTNRLGCWIAFNNNWAIKYNFLAMTFQVPPQHNKYRTQYRLLSNLSCDLSYHYPLFNSLEKRLNIALTHFYKPVGCRYIYL